MRAFEHVAGRRVALWLRLVTGAATASVALAWVAVGLARGAVWSVHPTPFPGLVSAVSCASAKFCTAVGGVGAPGGTGAMGWDGRRWRLQSTPGSDPANGSLAGASCTSSKVCVAVGEYLERLDYDPVAMHAVPVVMPLAERWNGVGWSLLPFPGLPPGAQQGELDVISCTTGSECMAVGRFSGAGFGLLAERWDGTSWSLERMPDPVPPTTVSQSGAIIGDLSCSSRRFCTAVGSYSLDSGLGKAYAERWDGSSWSLESTPEVAGTFDATLSQCLVHIAERLHRCRAVQPIFVAAYAKDAG